MNWLERGRLVQQAFTRKELSAIYSTQSSYNEWPIQLSKYIFTAEHVLVGVTIYMVLYYAKRNLHILPLILPKAGLGAHAYLSYFPTLA